MHYLVEEILYEILVRVPAKSLLRFKCVSRQWNSLISDPKFVKAQLRMSLQGNPNPSQKLLLHDSGSTLSLDVAHWRAEESTSAFARLGTIDDDDGEEEGRELSIVNSCHGLVCLQAGRREFILCNPTTWERRKLPEPNILLSRDAATCTCGMGYDAVNDDYKLIIGICRDVFSPDDKARTMLMFYIFSLRSNSWRTVGEFKHDVGNAGTYSNGYLHWFDRWWPSSPGDEILSFNLTTEEFHQGLLPLPSFREEGLNWRLSATGGGWLVAYQQSLLAPEVWIMKDFRSDSAWTKLCYFPNRQLLRQYPRSGRYLKLSPLTVNGKVILCARWENHTLGIYDPDEDSFRNVRLPDDFPRNLFMITSYVESLVSMHF